MVIRILTGVKIAVVESFSIFKLSFCVSELSFGILGKLSFCENAAKKPLHLQYKVNIKASLVFGEHGLHYLLELVDSWYFRLSFKNVNNQELSQ